MKTRIFISTFLIGTLLAASVRSHAFCVMQAFGDLAARYNGLVADVTAWAQLKTEKIATGLRWSAVAAADKQSYAVLELKGSLGSAEKTAAEQGRAVGTDTAKAYVDLVNDDVINSTRTSLQEMGEGFGSAIGVAGPTIPDTEIAACLNGVDSAISGSTVLKAHGYTPAELGGDFKTLLIRQAGDTDPPAVIRPAMWATKLKNGEAGAVAECAVAARLKRGNHTNIEIGADELEILPGGTPNPLYQARVDIVTDTEIHQVGLTAMTIKGKLDDDIAGIVQGFKKAMDAKPGRHYYFSFTEDNWSPLQSTIDDLNQRIAALYAPNPAPQVFAASDFRYISLDPWAARRNLFGASGSRSNPC